MTSLRHARCGSRRLARGVVIFAPILMLLQSTEGASPGAMYSVGSAFDTHRSRLVIFGGYFRGDYAGDTWLWHGSGWARQEGVGPSGRNAPTLAYDAARRHVVLFGGDTRATGALGDTWILDDAGWRQRSVEGPPPRSTHQMVYDSRRQRVVVFGGAHGPDVLGDTWEFDGTRWYRMATDGPSARTLHGLAYDSARDRTVLFGGVSRLASDAESHGDTWEWNGLAWHRIEVQGPGPRDHVAMTYDAARELVVLHGGGLGDASSETWTFDGNDWRLASDSGPRRRFARLEFDPRSESILMFGGFDTQPSNELWRLRDDAWAKVWPLSPTATRISLSVPESMIAR